MTKSYFISGANRGIGYFLVKELVENEKDVLVFATARNPDEATELKELKSKHGNIEILKLDVSSEESVKALDGQLKAVAVDGIDVFISNAGIGDSYYTVKDAPRDVYLGHFITNTLGPVLLFQVLYPYLFKKETRQIAFISSLAGSIGGYFPLSSSGYGASKAALNYVTKEISSELDKENFTVVAVHPGMVSTDMGKYGVSKFSDELKEVAKSLSITPEDSAQQQLKVFNGLTRESNGKFLSYTGEELVW